MSTANSIASLSEKELLSTTSRLVGDYEGKRVNLALAFPQYDLMRERLFESPMSRSGLVVAYENERPEEIDPLQLPVNTNVGQCVCNVLSVLYGKRFDYHGVIESYGRIQVPEMGVYMRPCRSDLPFNSHNLRTRFPVKLETGAAARVDQWLFPRIDDANVRRIQTACGFYSRALQIAEQDAEGAYLHLVIAGEVLASLDQQSTSAQPSIRKGFADSLLRQLDEKFFRRTDSQDEEVCHFKLEGMTSSTNRQFDMRKCLESVYDLRSRYVHSGVPFGYWVTPKQWVNDLVIGRPSLPDSRLAKTLEVCPTFCGLEQVIRYALLRRMGLTQS